MVHVPRQIDRNSSGLKLSVKYDLQQRCETLKSIVVTAMICSTMSNCARLVTPFGPILRRECPPYRIRTTEAFSPDNIGK
jgi:hypothetical protein